MMTMPTDIKPAAGTGGAARCLHCGSTDRIAGAYITASGRRDQCGKCGAMLPPTPTVHLYPDDPTPSAVPNGTGRVANLGWGDVDGEQRFRAVVVFDEPPSTLPINIVWDRTPVTIGLAKAPSAVPERAAGGGGLPGAENLAEALWHTTIRGLLIPWAVLLRSDDICDALTIKDIRARAAAILARLAQPRPAAADSQSLESGVTSDAAPGRVDAGAVREAAQKAVSAWLEHEYGSDSFADAMGELKDALALDAALDRAGDGWQPISTLQPTDGPIWLGWDGTTNGLEATVRGGGGLIDDFTADKVCAALRGHPGWHPGWHPTHWMRRQPRPTPPSTSTEPSP